MKFKMPDLKFPLAGAPVVVGRHFRFPLSAFRICRAFSLIEILVVVSLLSLIVVALMAVFSSTQRAFRSGITQTDMLEGGRAAVDLITTDLHGLAPSGGAHGGNYPVSVANLNFLVADNASYSTPLLQPLSGGTVSRPNLLQQVFVLNRYNLQWWGVGYAVATNSGDGLFALYRMVYPVTTNGIGTNNPAAIYSAFNNFFASPTNGGSHLVNGVVNFTVRAYDKNGYWIFTNSSSSAAYTNFAQAGNTFLFTNQYGETGMALYSNVVPAAVELNLAVVEDRALARAESFPTFSGRTNYLSQQSGAVHVFRQRVIIPNVDRMAYYPTNQ